MQGSKTWHIISLFEDSHPVAKAPRKGLPDEELCTNLGAELRSHEVQRVLGDVFVKEENFVLQETRHIRVRTIISRDGHEA